ncbi:MAG TPA: hypothetical protein VFY44_09340, partial [Thermoleophilaceae bacterium]|nr:hypothetical protein [Thermoleophilaceae bacterium]
MPTRLGDLTTVAARRGARLAHRARARAGRDGGRAAILLYHRVATPERDAWDLSVSPETFAAHMELLADRYRPLALADLLAAADAGTIP